MAFPNGKHHFQSRSLDELKTEKEEERRKCLSYLPELILWSGQHRELSIAPKL